MSMMRVVAEVGRFAYLANGREARFVVVFEGCGHQEQGRWAFEEQVGLATFQAAVALAMRGSVRICRECMETVAVFPEPVAGPPAPAGAPPVSPGLPAGRRPL